jgi:hypothetical protein
MYYSDRKTLTTSGVPEPLKSVQTKAAWIELVADPTNAGLVYLGGPTTTKGSGGGLNKDYQGIPLVPGEWLLFRWMDDYNPYDLQHVYLDADNDGDSVDFVYGRQ